jgi:hypothetical protein
MFRIRELWLQGSKSVQIKTDPDPQHSFQNFVFKIKYLVANGTLFKFVLFHRLVLRRVHFTFSNFAWRLHGDVDVRLSRGLLVLELH